MNAVGTVKSTINSAISLSKYYPNCEVSIINMWRMDNLDILNENSIKIVSLNISFYNFLPKTGFLQSRFSYIVIFLLCFFQLNKILKKDKPDLIICHLITSLPLLLLNMFKFKTDFILRISGFPKLHFIRRYFWKKSGKKLKFITCPTLELKKKLEKNDCLIKTR